MTADPTMVELERAFPLLLGPGVTARASLPLPTQRPPAIPAQHQAEKADRLARRHHFHHPATRRLGV